MKDRIPKPFFWYFLRFVLKPLYVVGMVVMYALAIVPYRIGVLFYKGGEKLEKQIVYLHDVSNIKVINLWKKKGRDDLLQKVRSD